MVLEEIKCQFLFVWHCHCRSFFWSIFHILFGAFSFVSWMLECVTQNYKDQGFFSLILLIFNSQNHSNSCGTACSHDILTRMEEIRRLHWLTGWRSCHCCGSGWLSITNSVSLVNWAPSIPLSSVPKPFWDLSLHRKNTDWLIGILLTAYYNPHLTSLNRVVPSPVRNY